nr:Fungalysin/Thermolysin Extracellular metalloproteinase 5 [Polyrhizophydium stewartii]
MALARRDDTKLPFFFPPSMFEQPTPAAAASQRSSLAKVSADRAVKIATDHIVSRLGLAADEFKVANSHTDASGVTHVYGAHVVNGLRVANHHAAAHVKDGAVIAFSSSFNTAARLTKPKVPAATAKISVDQAIAKAVKDTGIPHHKDFAAVSEFVETAGGIVYAHKFQLRDLTKAQWVQVWVDANTGEIVHSSDFVKNATYRVVQLPKIAPTEGFTTLVDPEDYSTSPIGWIDSTQSTMGNNVRVGVYVGDWAAPFPGGGNQGVYSSPWDPNLNAYEGSNTLASFYNIFYLTNYMHDLSYYYGFTEAAGNFQTNNFGKGGKDNDPLYVAMLKANAGASMATPPDGQSGFMLMQETTTVTPTRTSAFDAESVIHEFTHGISDRLTGGPATGQCLTSDQASGMAEGWSDFVAIVVTAKPTDTRATKRLRGVYAYNSPAGIRLYPYTTDMSVNPLKYSSVGTLNESHDLGTAWATMLWEFYWNMVDKSGFNPNLKDVNSTAGNIAALRSVIYAMTFQPCNPTFLQARNSLLFSQAILYGNTYWCETWRAFAKRGFGYSATEDKVDFFDLPSGC